MTKENKTNIVNKKFREFIREQNLIPEDIVQ